MSKVKIGDQVIYFKVIGNGPHTVALLPGYLGISDLDFGKIFPLLNKTDFRWICWDPPGYGRSRPQNAIHNEGVFQRWGDLLGKLMKELGYEKYSIVGWSMGGIAGIKHAIQSPHNVNKLMVWGSIARITPAFTHTLGIYPGLESWPEKQLAAKLQYFEKEYLRKLCVDMLNACKRLENVDDGFYLRDGLARVQCPTLILHGSKDRVVESFQPITLQNEIKNAKRVYYFPEGKHDLHLEFSSEFVKIMEEFLRSS